MQSQTCCFTGHRDIPHGDLELIKARTEASIRQLIDQGVKYFGVGGAIGYDTIAAKRLFQLRETEYPGIKIILVYPFEGYTSRWSQEQQAEYKQLLPLYNKIVCVANHPSKGAYLQRNRHLVDYSGYCIAYCNKTTGGTAYTLKYARSKKLSIFNIGSLDMESI